MIPENELLEDHIIIRFTNNYGLSIISNVNSSIKNKFPDVKIDENIKAHLSYSNEEQPFEVALLGFDDEIPDVDETTFFIYEDNLHPKYEIVVNEDFKDVLGYRTYDDVLNIFKTVSMYDKYYKNF